MEITIGQRSLLNEGLSLFRRARQYERGQHLCFAISAYTLRILKANLEQAGRCFQESLILPGNKATSGW